MVATKKEIKEFLHEYYSSRGKASWSKLTPKQRSERARHAVMIRWAKNKSKKKNEK